MARHIMRDIITRCPVPGIIIDFEMHPAHLRVILYSEQWNGLADTTQHMFSGWLKSELVRVRDRGLPVVLEFEDEIPRLEGNR